MRHFPRLSLGTALFLLLPLCNASITVYYQAGQTPLAQTTTTATGTAYTGLPAYDPTTLQAPAPPGPSVVPTEYALQLNASAPSGVGIAQNGSFMGFSIEMSVVNQVLGKNASVLQVPFLNLMANLQRRAGQVHIRVGGNTQETATLVPSTPDGRILEKDLSQLTNPTQTPPLIFTPELIYMLANISSLVNVRWYLGVPFNDSANWRLGIVEAGQRILGDKLLGLQAGNEPDLYVAHQHRPSNYTAFDYFGEFGSLIAAIAADSSIPSTQSNRSSLLGGPSISTIWTPEQVWNTGFVDSYKAQLGFLSVERYPTDNCAAKFPGNNFTVVNAQDVFPSFLSHQSALGIVKPYLNSTQFAASKGLPLIMFETNTASCGGFPGLSDSFAAALWGVDYALTMAQVGFSEALFHIGGVGVNYNAFMPPPTNESTFHQWTIGPIYYSALIVAEALGATGTAQVMDLQANAASNSTTGNPYTPAYAIYEAGALARVVLVNFVSDSTGASDLSVDLSVISGTAMPGVVYVKYLLAATVSQKGNFTWAGQTFGANFESDGRPRSLGGGLSQNETVQTVTCTPASAAGNNVCTIHVPAPGIALVFLNASDANLPRSVSGTSVAESASPSVQTFSTTVTTQVRNTATLSVGVLETSNGHDGPGGVLGFGSTSFGSLQSGVAVGGRGGAMGIGLMLMTLTVMFLQW